MRKGTSNGAFDQLIQNVSMVFVFVFAALSGSHVHAQDQHFSQFYTQPLTINPSNTGYFNGNYRIGAIYRAQWPFAANGQFVTYNNYSAYADFSFHTNKLDMMGIGAYVWNDEAGDGNLRTTKYNLSWAYHKGFDKKGKYLLSAGFAGTYVQRGIDFKNLYFNNQWNGKGFDQNIINDENYTNIKSSYFDVSAGLQFHLGIKERYIFGFGASLLHINRPKDSFYKDGNRIGLRPVFNISFDLNPNSNWNINANFIFNYQKQAIETSLGLLLGYSPENYRTKISSMLYIGAYYRIKEAMIPTIGGQVKNTRMLISYDFTLSKLTATNTGVGGFEVSLTHTGKFKTKNTFKTIYCPKF